MMKRHHHARGHVVHHHSLLLVSVGIFCGFFLGLWTRRFLVLDQRAGVRPGEPQLPGRLPVMPETKLPPPPGGGPKPPSTGGKGLVLIGVMTAKKYLNSRVVAAYRTWVTTIPGKVLFFSCAGSESVAPPGIPVVSLDGVDDTYPPQKKSFMMLKYMHDHHGDEFHFFMRADDDVYMRGERLGEFLYSINSSKTLFIGQAGQGNREEIGLLNLEGEENFCMGGPSMVLSGATLAKMIPHVGFCLKNLYTTHEDVEVGRCVHKFAGGSCTWAYEMQRLFVNNYKEPNGSFSHSLRTKEVHQAITLHPVKNATYQYRIHHYYLTQKARDLRQYVLNLHREIHSVNDVLQDRDDFYSPNRLGLPPSLLKSVPKTHSEALPWDFLTTSLFSLRSKNPHRGLDLSLRKGLEDVVMQTMEMINNNARQRGRTIDFQKILYGYQRVNPLHGADYILDLLLVYRKHKGKRRMTVPVRRHAYLQQTFTPIQVAEVQIGSANTRPVPMQATYNTHNDKPALFHFLRKGIGQLYGGSDNTGPSVRQVTMPQAPPIIHFLLPLAGRFQTFLQFMHNFEEVCLQRTDKVVLTVMLFRSELEDRTADTIDFMRSLQRKYPIHDLRVNQIEGVFSRGIALMEGSKLFPDNTLMFFIDVDIHLGHGVIHRIRENVRQHQQVYYPIVFSQYDPAMTCSSDTCTDPDNSPFNFNSYKGYWRQFGFGIAAMYKSDLMAVGGFDTSIQGWGKEDVDLYTRFLTKNVTIFRAADPGMVHIFHPVVCDPRLDSAQYQMCLGSKAATFGSTEKLSNFVYKTQEILYKNEIEPAIEGEQDQDDGAPNEANNNANDAEANNNNNNNNINLEHLV